MEIQHLMNSNRKKPVECVVSSSKDPLPNEEDLKSFHKVCPNASFFSLIPPLHGQTNYTPNNTRVTIEPFPRILTSFFEDHNKSITPDELLSKSNQVYSLYKCSKEQIENLYEKTKCQNVSSLWYEHRKGRITASKAHDVLTIRETTSPDNLVMRIIGYNSYDLSKKEAIRWGIENESFVRDAYAKNQAYKHENFICLLSGLRICETNYFLGASADGVISCDCCGKGTLEIKCPHKYKDTTARDAAVKDKLFCLDTDLKLKKNHKYYTQVQFQMFVYNTSYSDFVLMTCPSTVNLTIIRVRRDEDFINYLVNKCSEFMKELIIPELLTKRLLDKPVNTLNAVSNNDEKFCLCNEPEYGKMIFCDGESCDVGWFHYQCVDVVRKPRGKWFCPMCKK